MILVIASELPLVLILLKNNLLFHNWRIKKIWIPVRAELALLIILWQVIILWQAIDLICDRVSGPP